MSRLTPLLVSTALVLLVLQIAEGEAKTPKACPVGFITECKNKKTCPCVFNKCPKHYIKVPPKGPGYQPVCVKRWSRKHCRKGYRLVLVNGKRRCVKLAAKRRRCPRGFRRILGKCKFYGCPRGFKKIKRGKSYCCIKIKRTSYLHLIGDLVWQLKPSSNVWHIRARMARIRRRLARDVFNLRRNRKKLRQGKSKCPSRSMLRATVIRLHRAVIAKKQLLKRLHRQVYSLERKRRRLLRHSIRQLTRLIRLAKKNRRLRRFRGLLQLMLNKARQEVRVWIKILSKRSVALKNRAKKAKRARQSKQGRKAKRTWRAMRRKAKRGRKVKRRRKAKKARKATKAKKAKKATKAKKARKATKAKKAKKETKAKKARKATKAKKAKKATKAKKARKATKAKKAKKATKAKKARKAKKSKTQKKKKLNRSKRKLHVRWPQRQLKKLISKKYRIQVRSIVRQIKNAQRKIVASKKAIQAANKQLKKQKGVASYHTRLRLIKTRSSLMSWYYRLKSYWFHLKMYRFRNLIWRIRRLKTLTTKRLYKTLRTMRGLQMGKKKLNKKQMILLKKLQRLYRKRVVSLRSLYWRTVYSQYRVGFKYLGRYIKQLRNWTKTYETKAKKLAGEQQKLPKSTSRIILRKILVNVQNVASGILKRLRMWLNYAVRKLRAKLRRYRNLRNGQFRNKLRMLRNRSRRTTFYSWWLSIQSLNKAQAEKQMKKWHGRYATFRKQLVKIQKSSQYIKYNKNEAKLKSLRKQIKKLRKKKGKSFKITIKKLRKEFKACKKEKKKLEKTYKALLARNRKLLRRYKNALKMCSALRRLLSRWRKNKKPMKPYLIAKLRRQFQARKKYLIKQIKALREKWRKFKKNQKAKGN